MEILLTGGLGFIGSHICVKLLNDNYKVVIIDNLCNSKFSTLNKIKTITTNDNITFYNLDLCHNINSVFEKHNITAVIHLAGLKSVSESLKDPLFYYKTNILSTINLLETMKKYECNNLIFSSSATVYGNKKSPLHENLDIGHGITNPYGKTKFFIEELLKDVSKSNNSLNIISLRYFNPVGAHPSGLIGENPNGTPNNLMPYILKVAYKNNINPSLPDYDYLSIYGNTYETKDGTAIRDYIHVMDLAKAHLLALKKIKQLNGYNFYNIGSGKGHSVLDIVNTFKKVNNVKVPYKFAEKRVGDLELVFCDTRKSYKELDFSTESNLEQMCRDSWNYIYNAEKLPASKNKH